ncbi:phage regulatory protein/antirepressor Ant [Stenotrophomonas forensis]|uniref:Phage regulatory protein/antirepressor Ant n=1 Tax=Stenotrophomonas forensis TaxID=2871169 RepID=A0ABY7Y5Q7_9GAMM|nr:phage regulatory protein/antirepressor Ant [Stenotrophomonas sp. DFS-20110405]WDM65300.1 phage regulatory protein/antirepressor Ant [Stenotrophomonas sp. DFS-20110405]
MTNLVSLSGDTAVTSTQTIAGNTDNDHSSVIKLVRTYLSDLEEFGLVRFEIRPRSQGQHGGGDTEYAELNEQQATLLLTYMRNSPIVRSFKKSLVRAFFDMAQRIKMRASDPMAVLNDPTAMRGLLLTYTEKVISLEQTVAEQAPQVATLNRIAAADGSLCMRDAAKVLQVRPVDLRRWLVAHGWVYQRPGHSGWLAYQDRIQQGVMCHKVTTVQRDDGTDKVVEQARITPKGIARIGAELAKAAA